jgi:hypothetical protein
MSDLRNYPEGRGASVVRYIRDVEVAFGVIKTFRQRFTVAQLTTAGLAFTSCPALPGVRWRMCDLIAVAIGGAVTTSTSINVSGILAGAASELAVIAAARLTRSLINRMGTPFATAGAESITALADGASFFPMDANQPLIAKSVGGTPTVATHVDFILDYVADPA